MSENRYSSTTGSGGYPPQDLAVETFSRPLPNAESSESQIENSWRRRERPEEPHLVNPLSGLSTADRTESRQASQSVSNGTVNAIAVY